jgi:hypothetical protein
MMRTQGRMSSISRPVNPDEGARNGRDRRRRVRAAGREAPHRDLGHASQMRRRQFIAGLGVAVAWPVGVRSQRAVAPEIGYLSASYLVCMYPNRFHHHPDRRCLPAEVCRRDAPRGRLSHTSPRSGGASLSVNAVLPASLMRRRAMVGVPRLPGTRTLSVIASPQRAN